jgi:hypothetical protein
MLSSGNRKIEQPSFRATLIMYVAFNLFSSSTFTKQEEKKGEHNNSYQNKSDNKSFLICQKVRELARRTQHTAFTLGDEVPINHPWLNSTEKLKEEYST